ncbi:hypothetical protein H6F86_21090 [Phormidium sp. FACHB-592]|uniref:Uncharacterized protein n=1 Tax=Stenomitos frigidus AS-A4 TaxID=2933935 RepID=A0ABV0KHB8_9CYAN|nr:hypothetical protein [Phormidium sp. FACHB-592]MBD2076331.1 hypothetical protein [Phormidium sp. FACHB-592]
MQSYLDTLSQWVESEAEAVGGYAELAHRISAASGDRISSEAVRKWANQKVGRHGLQEDSLEKIAAYRKQTKEQVRKWLNGDEAKESLGEFNLQALRQAPIEIVAEALQICAELLKSHVTQKSGTIVTVKSDSYVDDHAMPYESLPALLADAFARANLTVEEGQSRVLADFADGHEAQLQAFMNGEAEPDFCGCAALSVALRQITGDEWTDDMIAHKIAPWCHKGLADSLN